jgi:hypothetical protein
VLQVLAPFARRNDPLATSPTQYVFLYYAFLYALILLRKSTVQELHRLRHLRRHRFHDVSGESHPVYSCGTLHPGVL